MQPEAQLMEALFTDFTTPIQDSQSFFQPSFRISIQEILVVNLPPF
jgi:hypothetical protein